MSARALDPSAGDLQLPAVGGGGYRPNREQRRHPDRFLRLWEVQELTGKSKTSIYLAMSRNEFPNSIPIGARSRAWLESSVLAWMEERVNAGRGADARRVA